MEEVECYDLLGGVYETVIAEESDNNNNDEGSSFPTWQSETLYPPSTRKVKNPSLIWNFGGFNKVD